MDYQVPSVLLIVLAIWSFFWKGVALWRAAQGKQKYWFIAMLPLNTVGLLELVYLTKFAKKPLTLNEIRSWVQDIPQKKKS